MAKQQFFIHYMPIMPTYANGTLTAMLLGFALRMGTATVFFFAGRNDRGSLAYEFRWFITIDPGCSKSQRFPETGREAARDDLLAGASKPQILNMPFSPSP
jgi:hypothetical protein